MAATNLNIRTDQDIKDAAEKRRPSWPAPPG